MMIWNQRFSVLLVPAVLLFACAGTPWYTRGEEKCISIYSHGEPGKTTEAEFLRTIPEADLIEEVIDGKPAMVRLCGWRLTDEWKSIGGTLRSYYVVCPSCIGCVTPPRILYYIYFSDGVLQSVRTP